MNALKFPNMFSSNSTNVFSSDQHQEITVQNTKLLLHSERGELFGDPYFGILLKHYLFDQDNYILKDVLIDVIYTQLALFIPQMTVQRADIEIFKDAEQPYGKLYCRFWGTSKIDYTLNSYSLLLFDESTDIKE